MTGALTRAILAVAIVGVMPIASMAQQTSTSTQTKSFEIIAVDGNQLVVRLPEGTRALTVADDFRFNVDGRQLSVRELQPGMKGSATITTQTTVTPVTVTEVKSGTVMQATGSSIIVRTAEGYKMFTQGDVNKRGVQIMRNGQPAQVSNFKEGDQLTATIITTGAPQVMTETEVRATLAKGSAAPRAAAASSSSSGASSGQIGSSATSGTLPATASSWPLVALASAFLVALGFGLTIRRVHTR